jgi:hypothetical protein
MALCDRWQVERCFFNCVNSFATSDLEPREEQCVYRCTEKFFAIRNGESGSSGRCQWRPSDSVVQGCARLCRTVGAHGQRAGRCQRNATTTTSIATTTTTTTTIEMKNLSPCSSPPTTQNQIKTMSGVFSPAIQGAFLAVSSDASDALSTAALSLTVTLIDSIFERVVVLLLDKLRRTPWSAARRRRALRRASARNSNSRRLRACGRRAPGRRRQI